MLFSLTRQFRNWKHIVLVLEQHRLESSAARHEFDFFFFSVNVIEKSD